MKKIESDKSSVIALMMMCVAMLMAIAVTVLFTSCAGCSKSGRRNAALKKQASRIEAYAYPIVLWPTENGKLLNDTVIIKYIERQRNQH
jgi:flagellar basal body-associated protein FliL